MEKKEFINELKKAYVSPMSYFGIKEGNCDVGKINTFFQSFVDSYLNSSVKGITDKTPKIEFKSFENLKVKVKDPTGKYDEKTNSIVMNVDRFSHSNSENEVRKTLLQVMAIVCHEHQHFKQFAYINFNENGETEKADAMKKFLGVNPEKIIKDAELGSYSYEQLKFMEKVMPESINKIASKANSPLRKGEDPVREAIYFRRPVEVDARNTSLPIFSKVANDVLRSGSVGLGLNMKKIQIEQWHKNFRDMHHHGPAVMKTFEEEVKRITPEHFVKYSEMIDNQTQNTENNLEFEEKLKEDKITFDETLEATKVRLGKDEYLKFLQEMVEKSPEGSYARKVALEQITELSKPTVSKVNKKEIKEEGYYKNEQPNIDTKTKNGKNMATQTKGAQENTNEIELS